MQTITIEKTGRRYYFVGNTYPIKDALRSAGAKWDADRRAWYTGKADVAERFSGARAAGSDGSEPRRESPGLGAIGDNKVDGESTRLINGQRTVGNLSVVKEYVDVIPFIGVKDTAVYYYIGSYGTGGGR